MATGAQIAGAGYKYLNTPYSVMDCQAFVEKCLADSGVRKDLAGSNAWYRFVKANGWIGTPEECKKEFGIIPTGAFLFILETNGKEPAKYQGDGIGNASHIGIYTGRQPGAIHSSASKGGVIESFFNGKSIRGGWNRVGLWKAIDYGDKVNQALNGNQGEGQEQSQGESRGTNQGKNMGTASEGGTNRMEENYQAEVIGGKLNLRALPMETSERLAGIPSGTILTVSDYSEDWARTKYKGNTGYVMREFLQRVSGAKDTAAEDEKLKIDDALVKIEAKLKEMQAVMEEIQNQIEIISEINGRG